MSQDKRKALEEAIEEHQEYCAYESWSRDNPDLYMTAAEFRAAFKEAKKENQQYDWDYIHSVFQMRNGIGPDVA